MIKSMCLLIHWLQQLSPSDSWFITESLTDLGLVGVVDNSESWLTFLLLCSESWLILFLLFSESWLTLLLLDSESWLTLLLLYRESWLTLLLLYSESWHLVAVVQWVMTPCCCCTVSRDSPCCCCTVSHDSPCCCCTVSHDSPCCCCHPGNCKISIRKQLRNKISWYFPFKNSFAYLYWGWSPSWGSSSWWWWPPTRSGSPCQGAQQPLYQLIR